MEANIAKEAISPLASAVKEDWGVWEARKTNVAVDANAANSRCC